MAFAPDHTRADFDDGHWVADLLELVFRLFAMIVEVAWKSLGARGGLQEVEEYGGGFQGWYWRGNVFSMNGEFGERRGVRGRG